jgi:hypothetical protein
MIAWDSYVRIDQANAAVVFTYPIVVDDFSNDGDATRMRALFEEYDCGRLNEIWGPGGRNHHVLPLPTSTKRSKFDSSYNK